MNRALLHQVDRALLRGEGCARKPHEIFYAKSRRRLERHHRDFVPVAQVVVARDDHAIAEPAALECSLEIRKSFITVVGVIFVRPNGRSLFASTRLMFAHAEIRHLRLAVDHGRDTAASGVMG